MNWNSVNMYLPSLDFFLSVFNPRNGLATENFWYFVNYRWSYLIYIAARWANSLSIVVCNIGELLPSLPVHWIFEALKILIFKINAFLFFHLRRLVAIPGALLIKFIYVRRTGWSASRSDPYMRTFCAWSRSLIFLGNHGMSTSLKSVSNALYSSQWIKKRLHSSNNYYIYKKIKITFFKYLSLKNCKSYRNSERPRDSAREKRYRSARTGRGLWPQLRGSASLRAAPSSWCRTRRPRESRIRILDAMIFSIRCARRWLPDPWIVNINTRDIK